jgi:hypothetical protein
MTTQNVDLNCTLNLTSILWRCLHRYEALLPPPIARCAPIHEVAHPHATNKQESRGSTDQVCLTMRSWRLPRCTQVYLLSKLLTWRIPCTLDERNS